ncbi:MAG TPA: rRNA maturation RNase YbeY [Terriglobia bacterium]|nr:rRNA maturation RNase YbeY [Terriglobia bacterium]
MILNQQSRARVDLAAARALVARLRQVLGLGQRSFNVCFVDDDRIAEMNQEFRGKRHATDVLSFPWQDCESSVPSGHRAQGAEAADFVGFLGDVVISVETAGRNAEAEGHALSREINWLILHGLLHLLGMDHETDSGEMIALEYDLRARLGLDGRASELGNPKEGSKRQSFPGRSRKQLRPRRNAKVN